MKVLENIKKNFSKRAILENLHVIIFLMIIFLIPIASVITPDKTFSDYENRELQTFPKFSLKAVFDAEFQSDFESYMNDQIVLRNNMVSMKNYLEAVQMKLAINGVYKAEDGFYIERHPDTEYDLDKVNKNVAALNKFVEAYGAEVYLVPNANVILKDKVIFTNDADIDSLLSGVANHTFVDDVLMNYEGDNSDLYYKTDHHWTTIAAYELYRNIVDNPVEKMLIPVSTEFLRTIHNKLNISMSPDTIYRQDSDTSFEAYYDLGSQNLGLYFDDYLAKKDKYAYFLDANHGLIQIKNNDIQSNERLLIIKDSYANCLIPFLAESYKEVDVIDLRFFNLPLSAYLKNEKYDRIIVLYNKNGFATNDDAYKLSY